VKILVLGGTKFVGRALVEAALAAGHTVTLFHRGVTNRDLFPQAEHVLGDRDGDLGLLAGRSWDVCIDVSGYLPRLVRDSATALRDSVDRYVYVSSISVYADLSVPRDESGSLATIEDETTEDIWADGAYGALKALGERAVTDVYGERATIVRPGYIIGPYDHTGRFPWWAHRAARGGEMIVPASMAREFQAIDTRDLADFLLIRARSALTGVFNATGPVPAVTMLDLVEAAASESDTDLNVEVIDDAFLTAQGIENELPLWADDPDWVAWARVDVSRAIGAGLTFRPIEETVAATLAHTEVVPGVGLEPEREAELLAAWHSRSAV
jgi:2'-hydroxyisoflavone reductase